MLWLGILLLVGAIIVFRYAANGLNKSFVHRPMIFNNGAAVLVMHLSWLVLLLAGLYALWQMNPMIVWSLIGIYAVLWILGYVMGSKKSKAKKIFKIYKQVRLYRPELDASEQYKLTATTYYQSLRWEERRILMTVNSIFENESAEDVDIKAVAKSILNFEEPSSTFGQNFDYKKFMKQSSKEQQAIDTAYAKIIGNTFESAERPELSKHAITWLESAGLNHEDMSNEQLQVFSEIDDHSKSNLVVRACYGIATVFLFLAFFALIGLDLWGVGLYLFISFVLWFAGNKLQIRRISKKFHQASIHKYAREKSANQ